MESLTLLSSVVGGAHDAVAALVARPGPRVTAPLPNPLHLSGSTKGNYQLNGGSGTARINGSGSLGSIGRVTISGVVSIDGASGEGGRLTVSSQRGKLILAVTSQSTLGDQNLSATYRIVGGTRSLAGETGSGTLLATLRATSASRGSFRATFG
jgi:hypothetical protein